MENIVQSTATVDPAGDAVTVKVFDSDNNFAVYTLTYHDVTTGAQIACLAKDVNSETTPDVACVIPRAAVATAGTTVLCLATLVPAGALSPIMLSLEAYQGSRRIDDGRAKLTMSSNQPANGAIRLVFVAAVA